MPAARPSHPVTGPARAVVAACCALGLALLAPAAVQAQAGAKPAAQALPVPLGSGAGVHSPDSPFAPLKARADVVNWDVLTDVKFAQVKGGLKPQFSDKQLALNRKTLKVQGFMMPLEPGEKQTHFLISSVPLSCSFCTPGGPESMVEVKSKTPLKYTLDAVVVEGKFNVLPDDPLGLFYRLTEAVPAK